ncbi:MAG TPA: GTP cyclohydrolase II [Candidatus Binatia bacterium]|jgi:GTP cyclohydrolase II|nr:GTP cyclohydrolase II [Candidatus Binatia bacterium]
MKKSSRGKKGLVLSEAANLPTRIGVWKAVAFYDPADKAGGETHVALIYGDVAGRDGLLVRVQSECLTSEVFGSLKCDCDEQLKLSMRRIVRAGRGVIVYLRQEGRGIGIFNKIRAYHLQDHGLDTVEANRKLGLPIDSRAYRPAAQILEKLGVCSIRLMTNNPLKVKGLAAEGVKIDGRVPVRSKPNKYDRKYLAVKKKRMGHDL